MQSVSVIGFPAGSRFIWGFPCEASARSYFACDPKSALRTLESFGCTEAIARIDGQPDVVLPIETLRLMASFSPMERAVSTDLFFADCSLPAAVLRAAVGRLDSDDRWGIVRLSDGQQVVMSGGMAGSLLAGVGIAETTGPDWRRGLFWHPRDLHEFDRDWQRQLSIEGGKSIERRYRIHKPRSNDPWEWYCSSFRLIQGEDGLQYHLGVFVGRD